MRNKFVSLFVNVDNILYISRINIFMIKNKFGNFHSILNNFIFFQFMVMSSFFIY